ncbi:MAG: DNA polymerase III subunit epsilon [Gammaproteobacteria bacterium]|nr:MAG: DNA polymerase III subunit epsilon [Gammaproteobacteria bacterium]
MLKQIILDTETTGLDPKSGHRVIEIGCIELINRKFTGEQFHVYLNPDRDSEEGALKVHGLTTEFLSDKPRFTEIYDDFIKFIDKSELLIHNAEFDVKFLDHEIKLLSKKLPSISNCVSKITDTLQIAREKHPGQRNSLDALVKRYEIGGYDRELHGALLDSQILGDVYLSMTGGQSTLNFSDINDENSSVADQGNNKEHLDLNLRVIELSDEEKNAHKEYLLRMKEETGTDPIGLN